MGLEAGRLGPASLVGLLVGRLGPAKHKFLPEFDAGAFFILDLDRAG